MKGALLHNIFNRYDSYMLKISNMFSKASVSCATFIIYKALLDIIFCKYIAGNYSDFNYQLSIPNAISGWILILIMSYFPFIFYRQQYASSILIIALNMIYFIPITTYCSFGGGSSGLLFWAALYWNILSVLQAFFPRVLLKNNGLDRSNNIDCLMYIIFIVSSIITLYIWWKYTGFRIQLNLDVYDIRHSASENNMSQILSYIWHALTIIVPILIVYFIAKRKVFIVVSLLFLTLLNFSYAGNKTIILLPFLLIGGYAFYRKNMLSLIFPAGIFLQILAMIEQQFGLVYITSYFFRRQSMLLAQLSDCYYRFFEENPIDYFRNGIMGRFGFESPYNNIIPRVIGDNFKTQNVNCNNGLLADVFSGLGYIGIIIMPIILIVCFRILDFAVNNLNHRLIIGLVVYYAILFSNASWSVVLLTHGFLIMCFMLFVISYKNNELEIKKGSC